MRKLQVSDMKSIDNRAAMFLKKKIVLLKKKTIKLCWKDSIVSSGQNPTHQSFSLVKA